METIKEKKIDAIGRNITKTIIITNCDYCGKEFRFKYSKSHYNRATHHYCCRSCQGYGNNVIQQNVISGLASKRKGKKQDKKYRIWCSVKKRAKLKGIDFNITVLDIPEIPQICPVLGIKIIENTKSSPLDSSPSLDRINPKLGYIKGNIRIISNRANRIKSDATIREIKLILKDFEKNERV